jgi:hypothetical protein
VKCPISVGYQASKPRSGLASRVPNRYWLKTKEMFSLRFEISYQELEFVPNFNIGRLQQTKGAESL